MSKLPEHAYLGTDNCKDFPGRFVAPCRVIFVTRGEEGYRPVQTDHSASLLNDIHHITLTPAQASAMLAGSMFGWHVPAADPDRYDEEGNFK